MSQRVYVAGVGMTAFRKPTESPSYIELGQAAVREALADAGIGYEAVQAAYAGYVYGDSGCGQAVLYGVGRTGIPIVNVNNNCSTGSNALFLARQAVAHGIADCVLAVGFEQMTPGALQEVYTDRVSPFGHLLDRARDVQGESEAPVALQLFGGAGADYQRTYGVADETFAMVSVKARRHAAENPRAIFRKPVTVEEVLATPKLFGPLTRLQCCPPTCGGAAAVLVSESFAKRHGLRTDVLIAGQALTTDPAAAFEHGMTRLVGYDMTRSAAGAVYEQAGTGPDELDAVELHDCFTSNEIITYEALGLCPPGGAERFIRDGDNTYGGRVVTNPSGGLLSKGHPLGATGLGQCAEMVWQLRCTAGPRQVEGARAVLQHNLGLGGACVVTLYRKA